MAGAWIILETVLARCLIIQNNPAYKCPYQNVGKLYMVVGEPLIMGALSFRPSGEILKLLNSFNI
jgi:hypothetical protein